jgi:carbonic anhydrase/acetyltransferase-like protein (isoleucine patch superfamily)
MLIEHAGKRPDIHPAAYVAPDATICGDVRIAEGARIMHGARLIAEAGGRIEIRQSSIVLENAVIRASEEHACLVGSPA